MEYHKNPYLLFTLFFLSLMIFSCNNSSSPKDSVTVASPEEMDKKAGEQVKDALAFALKNNGKINDSIKLQYSSVINSFYKSNDFELLWSHREQWKPLADSLYQFILH